MNDKWYKYKKDNVGGFFKLFLVLMRNGIWLLPRIWLAKLEVIAELKELNWQPKESEIWLGLAEPDELSLAITFKTGKELKAFARTSVKAKAQKLFRKGLKKYHYPSW